ncbi:MAG: hypothetical protein J1F68_01160 [Clostridiales bacterium]|nr:hypothetical protein [Clostridiales bacterium]
MFEKHANQPHEGGKQQLPFQTSTFAHMNRCASYTVRQDNGALAVLAY